MTKLPLDSHNNYLNALARLVNHYYQDEQQHFRHCSPASRKNHVFRDLRTVKKTLVTQLTDSNPLAWLNANQRAAIEVDALLDERRMIAVVWSTEDVLDVRADLTADQAWEVLCECRRCHDSSLGFNWDLIEVVAADLYPIPPDGRPESDE